MLSRLSKLVTMKFLMITKNHADDLKKGLHGVVTRVTFESGNLS